MQIFETNRLEELRVFLLAITFSDVKIDPLVGRDAGRIGMSSAFACTFASMNAIFVPRKNNLADNKGIWRLHVPVSNLQSSLLAGLMTGQEWEEVCWFQSQSQSQFQSQSAAIEELVLLQGLDGVQIVLCSNSEGGKGGREDIDIDIDIDKNSDDNDNSEGDGKRERNGRSRIMWMQNLLHSWTMTDSYPSTAAGIVQHVASASESAGPQFQSMQSPAQKSQKLALSDVYSDIKAKVNLKTKIKEMKEIKASRPKKKTDKERENGSEQGKKNANTVTNTYASSSLSSNSGNAGKASAGVNSNGDRSGSQGSRCHNAESALGALSPLKPPKPIQSERESPLISTPAVAAVAVAATEPTPVVDVSSLSPPPYYAMIYDDGDWKPCPPNSRDPVKFKTDYFEGSVLLLTKTHDDPAELQASNHPYKKRFEGRAHKYQFEVQVQGKFRKKIDKEKEGFLYVIMLSGVMLYVQSYGYISILLLSCSITIGALGSSSLISSNSTITVLIPITIILIIPHLSTPLYLQ